MQETVFCLVHNHRFMLVHDNHCFLPLLDTLGRNETSCAFFTALSAASLWLAAMTPILLMQQTPHSLTRPLGFPSAKRRNAQFLSYWDNSLPSQIATMIDHWWTQTKGVSPHQQQVCLQCLWNLVYLFQIYLDKSSVVSISCFSSVDTLLSMSASMTSSGVRNHRCLGMLVLALCAWDLSTVVNIFKS